MTNIIRSSFQDHPFHLVSPSPWPLYTSICLLSLTTSTALSMHNFSNAYYLLYLALIMVLCEVGFHSLLCLKLSNSGDFLKLLIPNYIWKTISGWVNYSCKVISQMMIEKEMENRGSKTIILEPNSTIVKEQRVNGSYVNILALRYTLMGIERNYQVKILSKSNIQWRGYISSSKPLEKNESNLNPWFLTGFTDGEGSFIINIYRHNTCSTEWSIQLVFKIGLHQKDLALLEQIQSYFGVGKISKHSSQSIEFRVQPINDLATVISHFDKYPLITQKKADFILWKEVVYLMNRKEHLTIEGLQKIVNLRASLNKGLSDKLEAAFPKILPIDRPSVLNQEIKDPNWLAGFTSAEGSFIIHIYKAKTKIGEAAKLVFQLTQHARDEQLMKSLIEYFNCGNISKTKDTFVYRVDKFSDIQNKIIPFFNKYKIQGVKLLDYIDFCRAAELMKNKAHLTKEGFDQIIKIKAGMNKGRS